eukprot:scaffold932_cov299-Prasinococcus_capsulatus_cf.AAC.8
MGRTSSAAVLDLEPLEVRLVLDYLCEHLPTMVTPERQHLHLPRPYAQAGAPIGRACHAAAGSLSPRRAQGVAILAGHAPWLLLCAGTQSGPP